MLKYLKQILILMIPLIVLTGCWDEIEIEERAFVYGVAVDLAEEQSSSNTKFELTSQLIVPANLGSTNGGGGSGPAYRNLSHSGESIFDANRDMVKQTSRFLDVTRLNVVLFSEELAKQPNLFKQSIDVFLREKDLRRGIHVAIASGKAKELLSVEPEDEKIPAEYVSKLLERSGNLEIIKIIRIGDIQEKVLQNESFPLPLVEMKDSKTINYSGIAIFHGQKNEMVGTLKGAEAKGLSFLRENKHTGTLNIEVEGETSTIDILKIKSKVSLENEDPSNFRFLFTIDINGTISEQIGNEDMMDPSTHQKFENELSKKIEELTTKAVEKLQKDYQTDVLGLGRYLKSYHPKLWEQTKDDWEMGENRFSKSEVNLQVNTVIERPGSMNRTSDGSID